MFENPKVNTDKLSVFIWVVTHRSKQRFAKKAEISQARKKIIDSRLNKSLTQPGLAIGHSVTVNDTMFKLLTG